MRKRSWTDKEVEAHWDKVANIYVKENNKVKYAHDQRFKESVRYLELKKGQNILNITSRDGEANDYILIDKINVKVVNAEISFGLLNVAASLRPQIRQVKIETYSNLPFKSKCFERIISLETIEHVAEPVAFIRELHRVAKPNARLVLSCPPATSELPYRIYTLLFGGHGEGPHKFPSSTQVKRWFAENGWQLVLHKGTLLIPIGPIAVQKIGEKIMKLFQNTFISELGIRQFYVFKKI